MMKIILTGGLGYIGSHTCIELFNNGIDVCIIDNLSNSSINVLSQIELISGKKPTFYQEDIRNQKTLIDIFIKEKPIAVIHFAALKDVAESFDKTDDYYSVNVQGLLNLLAACATVDVKSFVFSSSAAVYGVSEENPIAEDTITNPISPYGTTKLIGEQKIKDHCQSSQGFQSVLLRYFNPVGAHPSGKIGECPLNIPSNLMPVICHAAHNNQAIKIFGNDYPTKDGTGIRDYIHVVDLARSHVEALKYLKTTLEATTILNIGTGKGYSVLEMINCFEEVNNITIRRQLMPRREGDAAECFADNRKAIAHLNWAPLYSLKDMCLHSWQWNKIIKNST